MLAPEPQLEPLLDPPPPPGTGSSWEQDHLSETARVLLDAVRLNGFAGFTGLVADTTGPSLQLYWQAGDPLPPPIAAIVASPPFPVTISRADASFSKSYLESRADLLMYDGTISAQICGLLHTIVIPEEGYGLRAEAQPYEGVDPGTFITVTASVLSELAGVPVQVTIGPAPTATGRQDDQPPWWGGSRLIAGSLCSSGFGVQRPADGNKEYLMSAAHCYRPGTAVFNGVPMGQAGRRQVGIVRDFLPGFDSELIEVDPRERVRPAVFNGEWNAGDFITPVNTTGVSLKGLLLFVCTSGASSGQNCWLNVKDTNVRVLNPAFTTADREQWTTNLVIAEPIFFRQIWKSVAVAAGDSGGPVIQYKDGGVAARAMGTIVAGSNVTRCGKAAPGVTCFSKVYYADINNLLNVYGLNLVP